MYNHASIISCLRGLIGFESSYNTEHPVIDQSLLESSSGVYVNNSLHPLLNYDNILAVSEQFSKVAVRAYSGAASYKINDIVKGSDDKIYQSLQNTNLNHTPQSSTDWWIETSLLSAYLRRVYDGAAIKLFGQLFAEKKMNEVAKTLLSNVNLFEGVGNITGRITKMSRMVGYKIKIHHSDTIAILSHIGLQIDTPQNPIRIYLYHSSSNTPVKTFDINQTKSIQFQWHQVTSEILSYLSDSINAGGVYYLTYYEDELTGSAIKKDISFVGNNHCTTCSETIVNTTLYNKWSKFLTIQPFYVNDIDLPKDGLDALTHELWDEDREIYSDDNTWGINLQMSIQCDVTSLICRSKNILTDALSKQLTVDLLTEMAYSLRDNQLKPKVAGLAAIALDNQENGQHGEVKKLSNAIKALSFDFSSMSAACLPCNSASTKSKIKSVWS